MMFAIALAFNSQIVRHLQVESRGAKRRPLAMPELNIHQWKLTGALKDLFLALFCVADKTNKWQFVCFFFNLLVCFLADNLLRLLTYKKNNKTLAKYPTIQTRKTNVQVNY